MTDYLPIVLLLIVATLFVFGSFLASALLGPKRQESAAKIGPYECGIVPDKEPAQRFPVKFYLVAMIFIIFDIEIIFLYPWAVLFSQLGLFGLVEMILFSLAVVVSFVYLISEGALDWGPIARLRDLEGELSDRLPKAPARSTTDTIRRIPRQLPGQPTTAPGEAA
jgi:NADH-quinone oxidoreductase subunit A